MGQRLPVEKVFFTLLEAIDAFEASYRSDRFAGSDDSFSIVGGQGDADDGPFFSVALGRCIGGGALEFPAVITASLKIPLSPGEELASELDERLTGLSPSPGQLHLWCDDYSSPEGFFARIRELSLVQKYGRTRPTSCELKLASDDDMRDVCGKLLEYFQEHGCPTNEQE